MELHFLRPSPPRASPGPVLCLRPFIGAKYPPRTKSHKGPFEDQKVTVIATANDVAPKCYAIAYQSSYVGTNLTATNFLGISDAAISNAATGNITIKGGIAATGLSSLTPGSDYYVQIDGTFGTSAGDPSVKAGKALSATAINLEYTS